MRATWHGPLMATRVIREGEVPRECRTHGRLVSKMPQRHIVRPGTRRCKLARRDCVCSRPRCPGTVSLGLGWVRVSEPRPCSDIVHFRTPSTLILTSYRRCQGWKRCLRVGSWMMGWKDATHQLGARQGVTRESSTPPRDTGDQVSEETRQAGAPRIGRCSRHSDKFGRNALTREHQPLPASREKATQNALAFLKVQLCNGMQHWACGLSRVSKVSNTY